MDKILLFAGTTEGRNLAEFLEKNQIPTEVCVATQYGETLLEEGKYLHVHAGRLDETEMEQQIQKQQITLVIDATHPYAVIVSQNIRRACSRTGTEYIRLARKETDASWKQEMEDVTEVASVAEAAAFLAKKEGRIFAATGSKELSAYQVIPDYQDRVVARVLSTPEAVSECAMLGFSGKNLICMQGPFSTEMNRAMLKEYDIAYMVTKESGLAGGYPQKCQAALEAGVKMVVIGRPEEEEGMNFEEMSKFLQKELDNHWKVTLVGIGAGARDQVTLEAKRCCQEAELLIGAGRMIEAVAEVGQTIYEAYRPDEIISYIKENPEYENVTIALSGDTGFYSGAKKILELTKDDPQIETKVVPGVSSIIYFASKLGVTWEDAALVSLHGRKENLMAVIKENKKVFALVSNAEEIRQILTKMTEYGMGEVTVRIGTELSYKNEEIQTGTARSLLHYKGENLVVLYIENESGGESPVIPAIPDDTFVRGDVPMTKEEVRSISIAKLKIKKDAVVYDVGAGTGSISVEAAMVATQGNVYAIEQKVEAQELIRENARRMHVDNLHVIEGMAPEALEELPAPDCVFIGGSKGKLYEILDAIRKKNPFVRVVLNAISLETMMQVLKYTEENEIEEAEVIQVAVSRAKKVGSYHMMNGQNPIYVISFTSRPAKKEADPENEDDFVLEEINLDEVEPEDMTKVISVGNLTPEKIREEMEESE